MRQPWLSVLMPTYRGERYVGDALASVASESDPGVEVLVVDDGSDDRTLEIAASFRPRLDVRILEGAKKKNWVASTNVALGQARGTYACLLHQDDGWRPGRLAAVRSALGRVPDAALVLHDADFVDSGARPLGRWTCPLPSDRRLDPDLVIERLLVQNFVPIPTPVFRCADARAFGGLDERLWYTADWNFWLELARRGPSIHVARRLAFFRVHGESQTITRSRDADAFREQMELVLVGHLPNLGGGSARRTRVERAARLAIEVNVALATIAHGATPELARLVAALPRDLGSWTRFARDSRLHERVLARLRARARGRL